MHYLIDGHNLIAKLPDISLEDPDDEAKLVLRLRQWAAASRRRQVTVIFDGGLPGGEASNLSRGAVTVYFAPTSQTADALLIYRIQHVRNPAEYTLVSSDRRIIGAARERRMRHWPSELFVEQLLQSERARHAPAEAAAPSQRSDPQLSAGEVEAWLKLFPEPEVKPRSPKPKPARPQPAPPPTQSEKVYRRPLRLDKTAEEKLDADEVEEWLKLFNEQKKKK